MTASEPPRGAVVGVFSTKAHDRQFLTEANTGGRHELRFFEAKLNADTAVLASGCDVVCPFVNDDVDRATIEGLASLGVRGLALRSAGFNHVDLAAAAEIGIVVTRVPDYSPHAVAEHCVGLILSLNRNIHRAHNRVRESNFALNGLLGFDVFGKSVGVIGTGKIGTRFCEIMSGFGVELRAADPVQNERCLELGVSYVNVDELLSTADIIALHCPLTPETHHLIDENRLGQMKHGAMLINTSRGGLVDTTAVINALKTGSLGHLGLDVYEEEAGLFFEDRSGQVIQDDEFARLVTFPNVLVTSHQGFFTAEALEAIATTTIANVNDLIEGRDPSTAVRQ